jgi:hypothetical protein
MNFPDLGRVDGFRTGQDRAKLPQSDRARARHHQGTRTVLRSDQWFPRHSAISIEIGDPVLPAGADFQPIVRLRDQVRQSMFARCGEPDREELVKPEPMSRGARWREP